MAKTDSSPESGGTPLDPKLVREIALLISETDLSEIEVEKGDLRIRVARNAAPVTTNLVTSFAPTQGFVASPPGVVTAPPTNTLEFSPSSAATIPAHPGEGTDPVAAVNHPGVVLSPMVGTAYRKPSPEAENFIEVGSRVKAGDKLLLLEAMKTFNEVIAPRGGIVMEILFEDGQPVEYGEPLLVIE